MFKQYMGICSIYIIVITPPGGIWLINQPYIYNPTEGVIIDFQLRGGCKLTITLYNYLDIYRCVNRFISRYSPHHTCRGDLPHL